MLNKILLCIFYITTIFIINANAQTKQLNKKTVSFKVSGNCEECKDRIEKSLKLKFIYKANWNIETSVLKVSFDSVKITQKNIQQILVDIGHESNGFNVKNEVYDSLPECCKYTKSKPILNEIINPKIDTLILKKDSSRIDIKTDLLPKNDSNLKKEQALIKTSLSEVEVSNKNFSSYVSSKLITNTLKITQKELKKAACCNLSESFETSPSIDVSYTDAITGVKQIQLLGLQGNYTQITTENVPEIRGLAGSFGLTFIPGTFIENIQVTKGVGSVANGFESIAGQINIEEKKSINSEKVFINTYINTLGRVEATTNIYKPINKNLSTAFLLHSNGFFGRNDMNHDHFLDNPTGSQINFINRWLYESDKGIEFQFIAKYLEDKRVGGSIHFNEENHKLTNLYYGLGIHVNQLALTSKIGYVFKNKNYKSIGLMMNYIDYNNNSYYGLNPYQANQKSFYANLIFQSIFNTTTHKYRTGLSFVNDDYHESFSINHFKRKEMVFGAFFEYTYQPSNKFTTVLGTRVDNHNYFGNFTTFRLHSKWLPFKNTTLRITVGNGSRMANVLAENVGFLASSRTLNIFPNNSFGYGLNMEKAWNFGFNILQNIAFKNRKSSISLDVYRTSFNQQTVVDVDAQQQLNFYNLQGQSYSNTIQTEINVEMLKNLEVKVAYRFIDAKTNYKSLGLAERPLLAKHRAFMNVAYETKNKWNFDLTINWTGTKRLPSTTSNPLDKQMLHHSPSFYQLSFQVTKQFKNKLDVYIGAENLTNFIQQNLIIDAKNPFSNYFDASMVWGPMNGRIIYFGTRFKFF